MRFARGLAVLAAATWIVASPTPSRAQFGASDALFETITGDGAPIDFPVFFLFPPGFSGSVTIPELTIDFLENGSTLISDRFHFDDYSVSLTSATVQSPLAPRAGAIPVLNTGLIELMGFDATSFLVPPPDDSFRITMASGLDFTLDLFTDPAFLTFIVFPVMYDIVTANGTVLDYVDIGTVTGFFTSSDDQADYDPLLVVNGVFEESLTSDAVMSYRLNFVPGAIPEPGAMAMGMGGMLALAGCLANRRRRR